MQTVLFLCTGNYYRSRFAEELFNVLARRAELAWVATSRGLALERGAFNIGPISIHARAALAARGLSVTEPLRGPLPCTEADLRAAGRIVALKEAEHRAYLATRHGGWEDRVQYWHVHDLDQAGPATALAAVEQHVVALVDELRNAENE